MIKGDQIQGGFLLDIYRQISILFIAALLWPWGLVRAGNCSYNTWEWNTLARRSENHRQVVKARADLTPEEKDPSSDCTVCGEDQTRIEVEGIPTFKVCQLYVERFREAVREIVKAGWKIESVSAYRVGRSRGPVDEKGLRTQFSNHSFGTAIDINAEHNGLYANCFKFGPGCKLIRGGEWDQGHPRSITKASVVYKTLLKYGWKWGGEIAGKQKDFMHFSLSGY